MTKREKILEAALKLLVENGIHAVPMSAIAKVAHTGMGTIYNYFSSKDVLINAIYVDIKQKEEYLLCHVSTEEPLKTQFENYYLEVIHFYITNPLFFKFMQQMQASPIITKESKEVGYEAIRFVIHLLEKGQKERVIKAIEIHELLQFLGGTVLSYLRWYFSQENVDKSQSLQNQLQMVWDGIKT